MMLETVEEARKDSLKELLVADLNYDKSELIIRVNDGKDIKTHSFTHDKIQKITSCTCEEKVLFFRKAAKAVKIFVKNSDSMYVMRSDKIKNFDSNLEMLKKYAANNRILFEE